MGIVPENRLARHFRDIAGRVNQRLAQAADKSGWWCQGSESKSNDQAVFATLSFISRLPVPARLVQGLEVQDYVRGIVTFPFVGVVLGGISGGVYVAPALVRRRWRLFAVWRWRC
jgi:hypothetical protein